MTWTIDGDDILFTATEYEAKHVGARWDNPRDTWKLPAALVNGHMMIDAGLADVSLLKALDVPPATFDDARLYPAQRDAIARLLTATHGALVVLKPGYGKTATAVIAALELKYTDILLVAPSPLVKTWQREIVKWGGDLDHWDITTWDKFRRRPLDREKHELLILDESVMAKNRSSKRYDAIKKARRNFGRVWLLSGSPTTRYQDDLWTQLHLIWPRAYPSYWRFAERFCLVEETPWAKKVVADNRMKDAALENADLIITTSEDIELPDFLFEAVDVDLLPKQRRAFIKLTDEFIAELDDGTQIIAPNEIAQLVRLQQVTSYFDGQSAKHDAFMQLLPTFEPPHLVWTHWKEGANALQELLDEAGIRSFHVSGDDSPKMKDSMIESFKAGDADVLVLSLGVGKFGHTLTNVKTVHWIDRTWNADDYFQALHRVRRIGLTHRPVSVAYRAVDTTDELIEMNLEGKLGSISNLTRSDLKMLLRGLGQ